MKRTIETITNGVRVIVQEYLNSTLLNELVKLEKQQGELHNQRIVLEFEAAPWPQAPSPPPRPPASCRAACARAFAAPTPSVPPRCPVSSEWVGRQ